MRNMTRLEALLLVATALLMGIVALETLGLLATQLGLYFLTLALKAAAGMAVTAALAITIQRVAPFWNRPLMRGA